MQENPVDKAAQTIWDYMHMHQPIKKADIIFILGNRDTRTAEHAVKLYKEGWAPILLFAGSGSIHNHRPGREKFIGSTEAEVFANIALEMGVPKEAIIIENQSQNTGDNYKFALKKLEEREIKPERIIAVQKPYMERRTYATGKAHWPHVELIVTSPQISFDEYPTEYIDRAHVINALVGDLQRIREYPKHGYQIEQDIPKNVWDAYEFLVSQGYTEKLIKD